MSSFAQLQVKFKLINQYYQATFVLGLHTVTVQCGMDGPEGCPLGLSSTVDGMANDCPLPSRSGGS